MDFMNNQERIWEDRAAKQENLRSAAEDALHTEFMEAFYSGDTSTVIRTPGFSEKHQSMTLLDYAAYDTDDIYLMQMLEITASAAKAGYVDAQLMIEKWAEDYAKFHAEDAAGL